jgi:hypothetical protein
MMKIFPIMYRMGVIFYKQEQGHEFSGPWGGVRPNDYPDTYGQLLRFYCIKYIRPAYHGNNRTICRKCYHNINEHEQEQYTESTNHYISTNLVCLRATYCEVCERILVVVSLARNCSECIEEYIRISIADRNLLINGGLLRVINRWSR